IGAHRHAGHGGKAPGEGELLFSLGAPHFHRPICTGRDNALAIPADRHTEDSGRVSCEGEPVLSRLGAPHFHGPVLAPRNDVLAMALIATLRTERVWPGSARSSSPVAVLQTFTV